MKKIFLFMFLGIFLLSVSLVFGLDEIQTVHTLNLQSGNGVCEYYQNLFAEGETESININGEALEITYLGNDRWSIGDYEGELKNNDFFISDPRPALKGVEFDFSFMTDFDPEGNLGITEQYYYPFDCQGQSPSTGLVVELKISDGWNLVPFGTNVKGCSYSSGDELCKDDVLVEYYYLPTGREYMTEEQIERELEKGNFREYFSEENEPTMRLASKWIYVKPGSGDKKLMMNVIGAYIPYRAQYLENRVFNLYDGWNFLTVQDFMVYDDNWDDNELSLNDIKGNCDISEAFIWWAEGQEWDEVPLDGPFTSDLLGKGFIVKVSGDCFLGDSSSSTSSPPTLPFSGSSLNSIPDFPESIGDYERQGGVPSLDMDCDDIGPNNDIPDSLSSYYGTQVCVETIRLEYLDDENDGVFIHLTRITEGLGFYREYLGLKDRETLDVEGHTVNRLENHELYWWAEGDYDIILTQEYTRIDREDGWSPNYRTANGNNAPTKYFLKEYPLA
jgi:hypothetical protein